jgi:ABC-type transport system involved in multi-copper enzyme maturation permease subunit
MLRLRQNPVLERELRGRIRGNRALIILVVYLLITGAVTMLVYAATYQSLSFTFNDPSAGRSIGKAIFLTVMTATLVQVCVITPSLTAGAISGEKERQTYDLLITTLLTPTQIALGKLTSALAFALLLIAAALPMAGLAFLFGGVSGTEMLIGIIGLIMTALCYATIGFFWSTVMRTTLAATVMAQGTVIFALLIIPFLFVIFGILTNGFNGMPSVFTIYGFGLLLCLHPFIALGMTSFSLDAGENPFFFTIPANQGDVLVPSPWLAYVFLSSLITILFFSLAVSMLKPVQNERNERRTATTPPADPPPAASPPLANQ